MWRKSSTCFSFELIPFATDNQHPAMAASAPRLLFRSALRSGSARQPLVAPRLALKRNLITSPPKASSRSGLLWGALGVAAAGGAYYAYSSTAPQPSEEVVKYSTKPKDAATPREVDYQAVYNAIAEVLDAGDDDYDGEQSNPFAARSLIAS
jgi:cytochrome c peroxidase